MMLQNVITCPNTANRLGTVVGTEILTPALWVRHWLVRTGSLTTHHSCPDQWFAQFSIINSIINEHTGIIYNRILMYEQRIC